MNICMSVHECRREGRREHMQGKDREAMTQKEKRGGRYVYIFLVVRR